MKYSVPSCSLAASSGAEDRVVQKVNQAFPENRKVLEGAARHLTWFLPIYQLFLALEEEMKTAWYG